METLLPGLNSTANLHPMLVHFPIALWIAACGFAWAAALLHRDEFARTARWLLYLGTLGGIAAVVTGWRAAGNPPGHGPMWVHKVWMLSATAIALGTCAAAYALARKAPTAAARWVVAVLLAVLAVATTIGADRGALLVYRYHMGSAPGPREGGSGNGR